MKRAIVVQRLPHLLLGGLIIGLLVASAVVLPATPAQAADKYLIDYSISEDLSFNSSMYQGEKEEYSEEFGTTDSIQICEKIKSDKTTFLNNQKRDKKHTGLSRIEVKDCRIIDSHVFIEYAGKWDEELLKNTSPGAKPRIRAGGDLRIRVSKWTSEFPPILHGDKYKLKLARFTFPGKIKKVSPEMGRISGNTWILEQPSTPEQEEAVIESWSHITITAKCYNSHLGLVLGITIPAALIIVAIIVLLIVRSKRKKKQQPFPPYPVGSGTYPSPPVVPGNSPYPPQSQVPGYPATPGAPDITEAASYPPNVPPQGQPGTFMPGGYYPYPPANPQNPQAGYPMPKQAYGPPTPGFPTPAAPPQPAAGQQGNPEEPKPATESSKLWHPEQYAPGFEDEDRQKPQDSDR